MKDREVVQITREAQADIAESLKKETPTDVIFDSDQVLQGERGDLYIPDVTIHILGYALIGNLHISLGNKLDAVFTVALTMARATGDKDKWTQWAKEMGYENFEIPPESL